MEILVELDRFETYLDVRFDFKRYLTRSQLSMPCVFIFYSKAYSIRDFLSFA